MRRGVISIGISATLGVLLGGCDKTHEECRRLGTVLKVNEAALREGHTGDYKNDPRGAAALARAYVNAVDTQIKQVSTTQLSNTRLARYSEDLRSTLTEAKSAAQGLASAYDALAPPMDAARRAEAAWNESAASIKKACTEPDDATCALISQLPMPGTGDQSLADDLESYATKLEAIEIEDGALKAAALERVTKAREYAAALRATSVQAGKVDAVSGPYFQAIAKGRPALRDIDRECKR
jgi:hypothetical protein